ncbi:ribbon-helix-helix domain-containing protein [Sulfolobus tengchongensis]|uniref:Ribbon-helix-helix domain-containing protein n=1 Tax=Sulfolobus tengchongensis TaxID=207809 RepID=A0AAX4L4F8_9CREN
MFMYLYYILFLICMTSLKKADNNMINDNIIEFELDMTGTTTISFKLEEDLVNKIDEIYKVLGYANRSDFIRDAIIHYLGYLKKNDNTNSKHS